MAVCCEGGRRNAEWGMRNAEVGRWKVEVGSRNGEVGMRNAEFRGGESGIAEGKLLEELIVEADELVAIFTLIGKKS